MNASTSATDGGRPVKSSETRRSKRAGSSSGAGFNPSFVRRARTKASIGFFTAANGTATGFTDSNDQCPVQLAPSFTHCFRSSTCSGFSCFDSFGGGITSSGSLAQIRFTSSLFSKSPGTIATAPDSALPNAEPLMSSRNSPFRLLESGP